VEKVEKGSWETEGREGPSARRTRKRGTSVLGRPKKLAFNCSLAGLGEGWKEKEGSVQLDS